MRRIVSIVTACVIIIALFSGCGVLQKLGLQKNNNDELHPVSSIVMGEDEASKLSDKMPFHLYFANEDKTKLKLEVRYIPLSDIKKIKGKDETTTFAEIIVKELIKGPTAGNNLSATIPKEAKLNRITIKNGVATVDFSKEFRDKHPGGKLAEQLTLYSVANSLTELKEIEKVKFTLDGKASADFKGNFRFDAPYPRNVSLIAKPSMVPTSGDASKTTTDKNKQSDTKKQDTKKQDTKKQEPKKDDKKAGDNKSTSSDAGSDSAADPASAQPLDGGADEASYLETISQ